MQTELGGSEARFTSIESATAVLKTVEGLTMEESGLVRWLRPEYQAPDEVQPQQQALLDVSDLEATPVVPAEKQTWPSALKDRATAIRTLLAELDAPADVALVADGFKGRRTQKRLEQVGEILEMLAELGQIEELDGKFVAG